MSARGPQGFTRKSRNGEWGSKARKEYAKLHGLNHRADRETIDEQLAEIAVEQAEFDAWMQELQEEGF